MGKDGSNFKEFTVDNGDYSFIKSKKVIQTRQTLARFV